MRTAGWPALAIMAGVQSEDPHARQSWPVTSGSAAPPDIEPIIAAPVQQSRCFAQGAVSDNMPSGCAAVMEATPPGTSVSDASGTRLQATKRG